MRIDAVEQHGTYLEVTWHDGTAARYHHVWLRDHLPDAAFFDPDTGERLVDAHTYISDAAPASISVHADGNLDITWPDRNAADRYDAAWLHAHAYDALAPSEDPIPENKPWPFAAFNDAPRYDYGRLFDDPDHAYAMLRDFRTYGFAYLINAPAESGVVKALGTWLGYVREVAFGFVREIRSEPRYDNVAYTSRDVKPHIDGSNYIYPYEVQFLHCIENDAVGGDSAIVDGFAAAGALKSADPEAFDTLCRVDVAYKIGAGEHDIRRSAPVLEVDHRGAMRIVRFSNQQRRTMNVPFEDVERFYDAYGRISAIINAPENQLRFRYAPGDVLMFDNHRTLHARGAFRPETGRRRLQLATADMDMVDSRLRRLGARLHQRRQSDSVT